VAFFAWCHAQLWCLPRSIAAWATPAFRYGPRAWHFLQPTTHGLATFIIKPCVSSSSIHAQCNTLHTCLFYLLFVSCPHRMALITSAPLRQLTWRKISASNACTCTILLCYHALYSILIIICTNIAITFTCRSEKIPRKIKTLDTWCIQLKPMTNRVAMVPVYWKLSALKRVAFISAH